jgi:photosystem II stability/assembly factor-like uncharacterized protein
MVEITKLALQVLLAWFFLCTSASSQFWTESATGSTASLRGLSVATTTSGTAIWAAGAKGTVLRSLDHGVSWLSTGPSEFPELEFRSIHAWSSMEAVIASAGTPAVILRTADGGLHWETVHRDSNPAAFFDGLRFHDDSRGVIFGDPIDGKFVVLRSEDRGRKWIAIDPDRLAPIRAGEAGFAASNSAMLAHGNGSIWIGTGGAVNSSSRVHASTNFGETWQVADCPLPSNASSGIFFYCVQSRLERSRSRRWRLST